MSETKFSQWAIVELMGHRRLAGFVTEEEIAGVGLLRLDVFTEGDKAEATQYYHPNALYCLTPTTEEIARAVAKSNKPAPVERWELPQLEAPRVTVCPQCDQDGVRAGDSYCAKCGYMFGADDDDDDDVVCGQ